MTYPDIIKTKDIYQHMLEDYNVTITKTAIPVRGTSPQETFLNRIGAKYLQMTAVKPSGEEKTRIIPPGDFTVLSGKAHRLRGDDVYREFYSICAADGSMFYTGLDTESYVQLLGESKSIKLESSARYVGADIRRHMCPEFRAYKEETDGDVPWDTSYVYYGWVSDHNFSADGPRKAFIGKDVKRDIWRAEVEYLDEDDGTVKELYVLEFSKKEMFLNQSRDIVYAVLLTQLKELVVKYTTRGTISCKDCITPFHWGDAMRKFGVHVDLLPYAVENMPRVKMLLAHQIITNRFCGCTLPKTASKKGSHVFLKKYMDETGSWITTYGDPYWG